MSLQDPIADMLTRVRNAHNVARKEVQMPAAKIKITLSLLNFYLRIRFKRE